MNSIKIYQGPFPKKLAELLAKGLKHAGAFEDAIVFIRKRPKQRKWDVYLKIKNHGQKN